MKRFRLLTLLALLITAATGAMAADTYTVAGSNSDMFGSTWDPTYTANDMTKNGDGTYSITYTNVYLTENVKYKVVKNHSWDEAYPNLDRVINIAEAGTYTLTIHFNPTTHEVYETMPANKFDITLKAANANTIEAGKATVTVGGSAATVTDGKLQGVKMGTEVKMTAKEGYKFRKVEVKKKAAAVRPLAEATAEDLGKIAGADGNIYDTKAAAEAAGTTAVAMIAYVGSDTGNDTYTHGMALALSDEGEMNWSPAKSTCEGKSAVSGAAWLLPSRNQWKAMFKANGGNEGSYTGLNTAVATAGGDSSKLQKNERYWSSSEQGSNFAWVLVLGEDNAGWDGAPEDLGHHVRACLAF